MSNVKEIEAGKQRLRQLKDEIELFYQHYAEALKSVELNFQGELHKYACIRLAGFLEQIFHTAVSAHIKASSSPRASSFALSFWKKSPNLTPEAVKALIKRFDADELEMSFETLVNEHNILDRLGTLLKVRNDASHGKSYSGTVASVSSHKDAVDEIYKWILNNLL